MFSMEINAPKILRVQAFRALYALYRRKSGPYRPDVATIQEAARQLRLHLESPATFTVYFETQEELRVVKGAIHPLRLSKKILDTVSVRVSPYMPVSRFGG